MSRVVSFIRKFGSSVSVEFTGRSVASARSSPGNKKSIGRSGLIKSSEMIAEMGLVFTMYATSERVVRHVSSVKIRCPKVLRVHCLTSLISLSCVPPVQGASSVVKIQLIGFVDAYESFRALAAAVKHVALSLKINLGRLQSAMNRLKMLMQLSADKSGTKYNLIAR